MKKSSLHFEVHPSVVYQLGESLITDSMVAIIELVKNSYDADASYSKVVIDTQGVTKQDDSYYKEDEGGVIIIEDDGCGMNLNDLRNGWLTISNRQKLDIKLKKTTTKKGRTPLGDKGLGRLGAQKLGKNLEVYTKKKGDIGYHIGFSWNDFISIEKLENVEIQLDEISFPKQSGTKIVISGLMEPDLWKENKEKQEKEKQNKKKNIKKQSSIIERLKDELSRLISPYKEIRDFMVYIEIDGKPIDLIEITDSVRNNSLLRYKINFNENRLLVSGKVKLDYFLSNKKGDGDKFLRFLEKQKYFHVYKLRKSTLEKWFLEFKFEKTFSEIDKVEYVDDHKIANPGSFFGEIDAFNLNIYDEKEKHVFDQKSEYRDTIKKMSGIRVFRDGFAIRVDGDWLGLGKQQTIGSSYYGLRPLNTLGFISLTARDNMNLEETTDREGFKDTLYYRNFFLILSEFIKFSSNIQEDLRRSWNEFRKEHQELSSGINTKDSIADITQTIKKALAEVPHHQKDIQIFKKQISKTEAVSTKIAEILIKKKEISSELKEQTVDLLNQFKPILDESNNLDRVESYFLELNSLKNFPNIIDERIEDLHRQMEMMYESVALGLTAEALAHEINNIIDRLTTKSKAIKVDLAKRNITDENIFEYIEYVYSAVIALQKQMSFLSPTLRYVREKRNIIIINDFLNEINDYFNKKWESNSIIINISNLKNIPFTVKVNKGKLIQIVDNLILNSEYWLNEDIRQNKLKEGIIDIGISMPYIYVSDNGRGIDPYVEMTLFDPFVTTKAKGRGLGLFIVKQLLASECCDIILLPERNKKKHLFKFQIDLKGIIYE